MRALARKPIFSQAARWFDPRWRGVGTWAFILNRLSGIGLTLYLFLHLIVLSTLARGPAAYDSFIALAKSPLMVAAELLVVVAALYHGLNGLRIAFTSFGVGVRWQKEIFYVLLALTAIGGLIFAVRMFG